MNPLVEAFKALKDRGPAHAERRCVAPPVGCGKPIIGFRDALSAREYEISGWCQACQDGVFVEPDEDGGPTGPHSLEELPLPYQVLARVDFEATRGHGGGNYSDSLPMLYVDVNDANLITSLAADGQPLSGDIWHRPVLDVDHAIEVRPLGDGTTDLVLALRISETDLEYLQEALEFTPWLKAYRDQDRRVVLRWGAPVFVRESSPGKSHVYVDVRVPWRVYRPFLAVLAHVGVLEPGYVSASHFREYTALRLPWVSK